MTPREDIGDPRDAYAVLGVEANASAAHITSAHRRLARDPHSDANPERSGTYSQFARRSAPLRAGPIRVDPPANVLSAPWSHLPMGWDLLWKWTAG
ncbi:DnaJ domain-containing protein [Streptomyces sp. NPDC005283]|uniref:DnaJ domain-containing protein n=1 Tax=Streptomyces sp. NPDC005283 TaxID=3156871 RepID=UPI003453F41D